MRACLLRLLTVIVCSLALASCGAGQGDGMPEGGMSDPDPVEAVPDDDGAKEGQVLADSFFSGYAYVDANGNGQLDEADPPLAGCLFTAVDARGFSGGGRTNSDGWAMAWWPSDSEYPVTVRMEPPVEAGYSIIGAAEVLLPAYESSARFLFKPPEP